jgi:predicted transcriptional regulator
LENKAGQNGAGELFLELSSETRLSILRELNANNLKTQEIANRENLTATEAVRQLQRLADASLARRNPDGAYAITGYGKTILQLSKHLEFLFRNKEYFSTHDLSQIPSRFVSRIGELANARLSMDTMETMDAGQRILREAEEFAWGLGEGHIPELMIPVMNGQVRKGLEMKFVTPESLIQNNSSAQNVEIRGLGYIPAVIVLTEKEAAICFRFSEGRVDYAGFIGKDEAFLDWTKDLFLYYWDKARRYPIPKID